MAVAEHRVLPDGPIWLVRDSWTEAVRHIRAIPRNPEQMIFVIVQPVMFVLLFVYVFGGAIDIPGYGSYRQYLMPGIFAQTVLFNSSFTGVGLANDLQKGIIERLRSLPMHQSGVLVGRLVSDLIRNVVTFAVMLAVAFVVGFRFEGTVAGAIGATLLLFLFAHAFSWISAWIGLSVGSVEAANSAGFIWMFPLTFVSSAFVDTSSMPGPLRAFADVNPFTIVTNAVRALYNGREAGDDVLFAVAWALGITAVFAVLAVRRFSRSNTR